MGAKKYENLDVVNALWSIVKQNTGLYQSDFKFDKEKILQGVQSGSEKDRNLIWLSRSCGTCCFREWDVFLRDTGAYTALGHYANQKLDNILAYAVKLTRLEKGHVYGNLYPLDIQTLWEDVRKHALCPDFVEASFQNGEVHTFLLEEYYRHFHNVAVRYGNVTKQECLLSDPAPLEQLLAARHKLRTAAPARSFPAHIRKLREEKIMREAQRLLSALQTPAAPNGSDKACFIAELSFCFMNISDRKDRARLVKVLPFRSLELTDRGMNNRLFAVISPNEDRSQPLRLGKPKAKVPA